MITKPCYQNTKVYISPGLLSYKAMHLNGSHTRANKQKGLVYHIPCSKISHTLNVIQDHIRRFEGNISPCLILSLLFPKIPKVTFSLLCSHMLLVSKFSPFCSCAIGFQYIEHYDSFIVRVKTKQITEYKILTYVFR